MSIFHFVIAFYFLDFYDQTLAVLVKSRATIMQLEPTLDLYLTVYEAISA